MSRLLAFLRRAAQVLSRTLTGKYLGAILGLRAHSSSAAPSPPASAGLPMTPFPTDLLERAGAKIEARYFLMHKGLAAHVSTLNRRQRRAWAPYVQAFLESADRGDWVALRTQLETGYMRMRDEQDLGLPRRIAAFHERTHTGEFGKEIDPEELYALIRAARE